jgi:hypothetical protein
MGLFQRFLRPKKKRARIQSAPPGRTTQELAELVTSRQLNRSNSSGAVLQPAVELEESSTASLSGLASPPKRARANRTPLDWGLVSPTSELSPHTPQLPKLRPLPHVSRSSKKLSPRSAAAELVNARAGHTVPSDDVENALKVEEAEGRLKDSRPSRASASRRLSYNTPTPAVRSTTPSKPAIAMPRDDSLDVVDLGSPSTPARPSSKSPVQRPALAVLDGANSPMPSRGHGHLGAPHTLRPPAKHPEAKLVNRHRHSASTPSPSTFASPGRLPAHRHRGSPPSLSGLRIIGAAEASQPAAFQAELAPIARRARPVRRAKTVQWVSADVAVVFEVERVAKDAWGEASVDYKRNMQTLNMVRRTVPAGTSFAKCVLKLDFLEGGEGASVLSGPAGKVAA